MTQSRDATVSPGTINSAVDLPAPGIRIKTHLWIQWTRIALKREREAIAIRAAGASSANAGADLAVRIEQEFEACLVGVAACAHALDALYGALRDLVHNPAAKGWRHGKPARHSKIFETIKHGFDIGARTNSWPADFEWLFELRDAAVHHKEKWSDPAPHPLGTNVSQENSKYSLEAVTRAVDVLLEVFDVCATRPKQAQLGVKGWSADIKDLPAEFREQRG